MEKLLEPVPQALAAATVLDEKGAVRPVSALWEDRTTLLLFVRHFG
jgi:hypothetical protein